MGKGIAGTIPCEMFGGPLDGARYGDLPDMGQPFTNCELSTPLGQPAELHPAAIYVCRGDAPVHGFWQFFYLRTDYPTELEVIDLPIPHPAPPRIPRKTCAYPAPAGWNSDLQVALARGVATIAHKGQLDKAGAPYLTHAARVAAHFDPVEHPIEHCAAWLHDVVEDTALTAQDLMDAGIHSAVIEIVTLLTRDPRVPPRRYYLQLAENPLALAVKEADILDNIDPNRTRHLDPATRSRLADKYDQALRTLASVTHGGTQ